MAQVARASKSCLPSCGLTSGVPVDGVLPPVTTLDRDILREMSVTVRTSPLDEVSKRMEMKVSTYIADEDFSMALLSAMLQHGAFYRLGWCDVFEHVLKLAEQRDGVMCNATICQICMYCDERSGCGKASPEWLQYM